MIVEEELDKALNTISSNFLICFLALEKQGWNYKTISWFKFLIEKIK